MKARPVIRAMKNRAADMIYTIRNEREYDAAVERLNALVDEIGDDPKDPRYRLIETRSVLIKAYDRG
jgi:HTH-type transcriptional regulator/antitoxin HigA